MTEYSFAGPYLFEVSPGRLAIRNKESDKVYSVEFKPEADGLGIDGVKTVLGLIRQQFEAGEDPGTLTESNAQHRDAQMMFIAGTALDKIKAVIADADAACSRVAAWTNETIIGGASPGV